MAMLTSTITKKTAMAPYNAQTCTMLDSTVVVLSAIKTHQNEATTDHGPAPKLLQLGRSLEKLWSRHLLRKYSVALRRIEKLNNCNNNNNNNKKRNINSNNNNNDNNSDNNNNNYKNDMPKQQKGIAAASRLSAVRRMTLEGACALITLLLAVFAAVSLTGEYFANLASAAVTSQGLSRKSKA